MPEVVDARATRSRATSDACTRHVEATSGSANATTYDVGRAHPGAVRAPSAARARSPRSATPCGRTPAGINRLNVYPVPDGDTGTNMARTLDAVVAEMDDGARTSSTPTCDAISHGSLMGARGNSGVILSQILRGLAGDAEGRHADAPAAARSPRRCTAAAAGAYQAVLKPIEGTILTVVRESAEAAEAAAADGRLARRRAAGRARRPASAALDNTPELLPVLKDAGVVDAGGAGFLLLLDSALHVVAGDAAARARRAATARPASSSSAVAHRHADGDGELDVSEQRYEVMYFLDLADDTHRRRSSRRGATIGDSIVVVGGDGLWNCHVHTNDIGAAIEVALDLGGRPQQIRVTDLFEEVAEEHAKREAAMPAATPPASHRAGGGLPPVTTRGRRGVQRRRPGGAVRPARCAGRRHRWPDDEPVDRRAARRRRARQRRPGRDPARTTRTSSRSPSRSTR